MAESVVEIEKGTATATQGRVRVQLDFSQDAFDRLQALKDAIDARSNAEVIRKALQVFEWVYTKRREGSGLQLVRKDGKVTDVELIL